jgi:hypothetical protein
MQGTAGNVIPPPGFLPAVRAIAKDHGALFIADEMITGFGRTGRMWGADHDGVVADVMTVGKGVGGQAEHEGEVSWGRPLQEVALRDDDGEVLRIDSEAFEEQCRLGIVVGVDPVVGRRLRTAYSRNAMEAGVNVDPMIFSVSAAREQHRSAREERLEHGVAQPDVGHDSGAEDSAGTTTTSLGSATRAVRYGRCR